MRDKKVSTTNTVDSYTFDRLLGLVLFACAVVVVMFAS